MTFGLCRHIYSYMDTQSSAALSNTESTSRRPVWMGTFTDTALYSWPDGRQHVQVFKQKLNSTNSLWQHQTKALRFQLNALQQMVTENGSQGV